MPERKDITTVKDQRDCDKMGIQKLIQKTRDRTIEVLVVAQLKFFVFQKGTMEHIQKPEKVFPRGK